MIEITAIWDTGATSSVISQRVVEACGLKRTGTQRVYYAHSEDPVDVSAFLVNIRLPNNVERQGLPVTLGAPQGADILVGMDIIGVGDFAVTNRDGKTKFSFRLPSRADIDFVAEDKKSDLIA